MNTIISFLALTFLLWAGRPLLLPLIVAAFFWYLTGAIGAYYRKIIKSDIAARILSIASIVGVVYFFLDQIRPMLADLYNKIPEIVTGIGALADRLSYALGVEISFAVPSMSTIHDIVTSVGSSLAGGAAMIFMIIVYILFLFIEQKTFTSKLRALFPTSRQFNKAHFLISSIDSRMKKYLGVKTGISFLTAVFSYIGMLALSVDFAIVWAFFVFILTYIPTIGAIVAGALPTIYVFALTGDVQTSLLVALWIGIVNVILGNIMEPKLTGKSLNLSALAILINMVFWGILWGPIGMFFSVPILVAVFVVAAQFDKYRWVAVLLSAAGQIPEKKDEE
jgi:predicted PurR-regulated permease PerM